MNNSQNHTLASYFPNRRCFSRYTIKDNFDAIPWVGCFQFPQFSAQEWGFCVRLLPTVGWGIRHLETTKCQMPVKMPAITHDYRLVPSLYTKSYMTCNTRNLIYTNSVTAAIYVPKTDSIHHCCSSDVHCRRLWGC